MARTPSRRGERKPLGSTLENYATPDRGSSSVKKKTKRGSPTSQHRGDGGKRQKQQYQIPIPNINDVEALPFPNAAEVLAELDNETDRNFQVLLWEIDCHYILLPHQFKGVRAIAGVPADFPGPGPAPPTQEAALMEWVLGHLRKVKEPAERGVLMGDVMGLGKTVR